MTSRDMIFALKQSINMIDSNAFRALKIPEYDWHLNEAHRIYVNNIVAPKRQAGLTFELNKRTVNDIRTIVVNQDDTTALTATEVDSYTYTASLPSDFMYYISAYVQVKKGDCRKKIRAYQVQQDDISQESYFATPSFEWEEANIWFTNRGMVVKTDGSFTVEKIYLNYVRKWAYVHSASDFHVAGYRLPGGALVTGYQDSELPETCHSEIVDIATALIAIALNLPNQKAIFEKLKLTN